jgi:DNA topoisomerase VI subunit B
MSQSNHHPDAPYFMALKQLKAKRKSQKRRRTWFMAASVAVLVSVGLLTIPTSSTSDNHYTETEEAYQETQKALMLLSNKLNESSQKKAPVGQFEKTKRELEHKTEEGSADTLQNAKTNN